MCPKVASLKLRNNEECKMFIGGYSYLTEDLEFSINMIGTAMIAVGVSMFYF